MAPTREPFFVLLENRDASQMRNAAAGPYREDTSRQFDCGRKARLCTARCRKGQGKLPDTTPAAPMTQKRGIYGLRRFSAGQKDRAPSTRTAEPTPPKPLRQACLSSHGLRRRYPPEKLRLPFPRPTQTGREGSRWSRPSQRYQRLHRIPLGTLLANQLASMPNRHLPRTRKGALPTLRNQERRNQLMGPMPFPQ